MLHIASLLAPLLGLARYEANKRYVPEELTFFHAPACLGLERSALVRIEAARFDENIRAAIDEGEHVRRLRRLRISVASEALDREARRLNLLWESSAQPGIVEVARQHGIHGVLQWIVVADRNHRRRVVPVKQGQPSARSKPASTRYLRPPTLRF